VKQDGVFITNYHVIEDAYSATIKLIDGTVFDDISLIDFNAEWDVAVLKAKGVGFPTVRLGSSDSVQTGQRIGVQSKSV
jgi:S1-C subfamily serine protease